MDTPFNPSSQIFDWTEEVPRPRMTGPIADLPQPLLEMMGQREQDQRYSTSASNHLAIYLPDGIVMRWHPEETNNQYYSQVIKNDGKSATKQMLWMLRRSGVTMETRAESETNSAHRSFGDRECRYRKFLNTQINAMMDENSICLQMHKDLDITGSSAEREALLLQWWGQFYPGHPCLTFTHKCMCKVCIFIIYAWITWGLPFWGHDEADEQLAETIGMHEQ